MYYHTKYKSRSISINTPVTILPRHTGKPTHTVVLKQYAYPKGKER